jgi:molybdenum cofactor cytidylyltransferase
LIDALIEAFDPPNHRAICVPVRSGRRGNPVLWNRAFFPELLTLEGDAGAKRLMALHEDVLYELEAGDDGPLIDIDTPEDLKAHE